MKTLNVAIISLSIMIGFVAFENLHAAGPAQVASDHLTMAKSYEEKAGEQDAIIAEHAQMKNDYKRRFFINEKITPLSKLKKMEDHCDNIINDAQKLKDEYLESAKWHRMRAAELQGR